ncbi:RNA-binding domain-containing protein [Atopobium sp. oral taxon 810]
MISSFANVGGGWIFIGVKNDRTIVCINAPRTNYEQTAR